MSENNIEKNLESISKTLISIKNSLFDISNKIGNNWLDMFKNKNIVIDAFPSWNGWDTINGSSILKTEITNFPVPPKKDKEYLIFNTSTITDQVRLKLLLLSLLGFFYSIYDIEISTLFWTTLKDDNNNLPSVLFTLILIELFFFLSVYYRDLKKHNVENKHIKNKNFSNIKDIEKKIKLIKWKNTIKLIEEYLKNNKINLEIIENIKGRFKYSEKSIFSDTLSFTKEEIEIIEKLLSEYIKETDISEWLKKIDQLILIDSRNREILSDLEYELSCIREEKSEIDLELFNKNYIFIIFKWLYPIFLSLLSLYFLFTYNKLNIEILNNFYKWLWWLAWILILLILIYIAYKIINNILKTNKL